MEQLGSVKAKAGTFKAPLGRGKNKLKGDREDCPGICTLVSTLQRLRGSLSQGVDKGEMVGKYPLCREGNREGWFSSQPSGDGGSRSFGVVEANVRTNVQGGEDLGESWFH